MKTAMSSSVWRKIQKDMMTGSPEKIEKREKKKTHHSAMKSVGVISFAIFIVTFAAINIIATITSPAYAQAINDRRPITETIDIKGQNVDTTFCGENGEGIELRGCVRLEYQLVEKGAWRNILHLQHVNSQGVTTVGLTTGKEYVFTYTENINYHTSPDGTGITTYRIGCSQLISKDPEELAPDLIVHSLAHTTVIPNRHITAWIDNLSVECS